MHSAKLYNCKKELLRLKLKGISSRAKCRPYQIRPCSYNILMSFTHTASLPVHVYMPVHVCSTVHVRVGGKWLSHVSTRVYKQMVLIWKCAFYSLLMVGWDLCQVCVQLLLL